ncbi:hypothetical protein IT408_04865 [Candidatus Uhrbacteria bacterium]|nr:hypothetical protein [Candidatus Uhrbacteria bacterium]
MTIPADPRKSAANKDLLQQVTYAKRPIGRERSLLLDMCSFNKDWSEPAVPPPGGIRMQIWNRPILSKDGAFMKVPLGDYLETYAEGVRRKDELKPAHMNLASISEAVSSGVKLVEYQHQFFIQVHKGEILTSDQLTRIRDENEYVWKAATEGDCKVYDLTRRDHTIDFDSKKSTLQQCHRFEIDGLGFRKFLREQCSSHHDERNRTITWWLSDGNLLIAYQKDDEDKVVNGLIIPRWIAECMRETYLQALIQILPGWINNYPAPDIWSKEHETSILLYNTHTSVTHSSSD